MERFDISNEKPCEVLKFFKEISEIPRKSGNEKKVRDYLMEFAKERKLEYYTDKYYNIIIRKINDKNNEWLAFQGHTDMICEKEEWSNHDFDRDGIELIKDGDLIKANGTTLGADNGLGVAFMLALLDSKKLEMPNLECIFTVQEETTMIGAKLIDVNEIKSKKIISLDHGEEGKMIISSANCMEWFGKIKKEYIENNNMYNYELSYSNFKGGHSGADIADKSRGNPIKLGIEILSEFKNIYINEIKGGSRVNVIPRDFNVKFSSKENIEDAIQKEIEKQKEIYGKDVKIKVKKIPNISKILSLEITQNIINFIKSFENGALKYNHENKVVLSANLGAINEFDEYIRLEYSLRSNEIQCKNDYLDKLSKKVEEDNIEIIWEQELKGFEPDYTSDLVTTVSDIYKKMFHTEIEKIITQTVIEGGFFKDRIKDLEYICIGANTYDVHSPKERMSLKSIGRVWELLQELAGEGGIYGFEVV